MCVGQGPCFNGPLKLRLLRCRLLITLRRTEAVSSLKAPFNALQDQSVPSSWCNYSTYNIIWMCYQIAYSRVEVKQEVIQKYMSMCRFETQHRTNLFFFPSLSSPDTTHRTKLMNIHENPGTPGWFIAAGQSSNSLIETDLNRIPYFHHHLVQST